MADKNPKKGDDLGADDSRLKNNTPGDQPGDNSEWLRDQTGEDHNLSGSSTYRTLPDQPDAPKKGKGSSASDASKRQSNR